VTTENLRKRFTRITTCFRWT